MPSSLQHEKKKYKGRQPCSKGRSSWEIAYGKSKPSGMRIAASAQPAPTGTLSKEGRTRHRQAVPSLAHPQVSKAQSPSPREPRQSGLGDWALHWHLLSWKPHTRATMQTPHRGPCSCENRGFTLCRFHLCELTLTHQTLKKNGTAAH